MKYSFTRTAHRQNYMGYQQRHRYSNKSQQSSPSIALQPHQLTQPLTFNPHSQNYLKSDPYKYAHNHYHQQNYQNRQMNYSNSNQKRLVSGWQQKVNINQRKQSIEVINKKIQNILDSIDQQQKRKDVYTQKYSINLNTYNQQERYRARQYTQEDSQPRRHNISTPQRRQLEERNFNAVCTPSKENYQKEHQSYSRQYSDLSSIQQQPKYRTPLKDMQYPTQQSRSIYDSTYRMKHSIYSNRSNRSNRSQKQNDLLVKGRNITDQINKLQIKIQKLQEKKKEMKLEEEVGQLSSVRSSLFQKQNTQPLELPKSSMYNANRNSQINEKKSSLVTQGSHQSSLKMTDKEITFSTQAIQNILSQKSSIVTFNGLGDSLIDISTGESNIITNKEDVYVPKLLRNLNSKKKKKVQKLQTEPCISIAEKHSFDFSDKISIQINKPSIPSAQALPTPTFSSTSKVPQIKRLMQNITAQIILDEKFRKAKKWFQRNKKDNKWFTLSVHLSQINIRIPQQQLQKTFNISYEEQNPFYSPRESDFSLQQLIKAYQSCTQHWNTKILHSYNFSQLAQGGFKQSSIDIRGRGLITIEDLVRYVNYQMDCFYRNRDLFLIYNRFKQSSQEQIKFKEMQKILSTS